MLIYKIHNLHSTIYYIRKRLKSTINKKDLIKYSKGYYWFDKNESCWVDCFEFESLYKKAVNIEKENREKALNLYNKALKLYKGEYLADDIYEDWTREARQYYQDLLVHVALRSAKLEENINNNLQQAIHICKKSLKFCPYREELYQELIYLFVKDKRYIEAIKTFQDYNEVLIEEFGVQPYQLEDFFQEVDLFSSEEIKDLKNIQQVPRASSPFFCNRQLFELIYNLDLKRYYRYEDKFTLITIGINGKFHREIQQYLINVFQKRLRSGDVICIWGEKSLVLMLYKANDKDGRLIKKRLFSGISNNIKSKLKVKTYFMKDVIKYDNIQEAVVEAL